MLRIEGLPAAQPLAELDPFSCQLRFYAIAVGPREALVAIFRSVPDQVRILVLESENAQSYRTARGVGYSRSPGRLSPSNATCSALAGTPTACEAGLGPRRAVQRMRYATKVFMN